MVLPRSCERPLLERFLKAEAMAMWSVRAAQSSDVPAHVAVFLRRHEAEEQGHLKQFEAMLGVQSWEKPRLPRVPKHWAALAVHLYGYEALGLEFAKLLAGLRPDLSSIVEDEEQHVAFFERELTRMIAQGGSTASTARESARAWWKRFARTLDRYLGDSSLDPYRARLRPAILTGIEERFVGIGLMELQ
ncbi:MAG TPA: hypothetical protein VJ805_15290 [Nitrospiraceae bacterium]|nr:hypothetical protein [Nitrospiraceae bacterium]